MSEIDTVRLELKHERETLQRVASWLRGEFEFVRHGAVVPDFNMDNYARCIGGFAYLMENPDCDLGDAMRHVMQRYGEPLDALYYPPAPVGGRASITRDEAARAIDNYLATGRPDWHGIFAETRP